MNEEPLIIRWAEKLRPDRLRRLYENDAKGLIDDALVDDVGWTLMLRCESILLVCHGGVRCPRCRTTFHCVTYGENGSHAVFPCPQCDWITTETAYTQSYRGQDLSGRGALPAFQEFVDRYPAARTAQERMLRIDRVIHAFHHDLTRSDHPHRAAAVNLIEGSRTQVIEFLDRLTFGSGTSPERAQSHAEWQAELRRMRQRRS